MNKRINILTLPLITSIITCSTTANTQNEIAFNTIEQFQQENNTSPQTFNEIFAHANKCFYNEKYEEAITFYKKALELNLEPLAILVDSYVTGVDPKQMGIGPVVAI